MIANTNKNVICVKNIPSNIIEEAIFILKNDFNSSKSDKINKIKNDIFLKESESIIREYSLEYAKEKVEDLKNRKKKIKIVLGAIGIILICIAVLVLI